MNESILAYFITWTCYGTHLPGVERGWTKWHKGEKLIQPLLADWCRERMSESAVLLDQTQRKIVNRVIKDHCDLRHWKLHAVNCRSNHCHVVATADGYAGEQVRDQFKSWATRRLKEFSSSESAKIRKLWWTRGGSVRHLFDENSLEAAILYTLEAQNKGGSKAN